VKIYSELCHNTDCTKNSHGDEDHEVGWFSTHRGDGRCVTYRKLAKNVSTNAAFGTLTPTCKDSIKIHLTELKYEDVDCIQLVQDKVYFGFNTVTKSQIA
jgi:hypothetical protein